uniref:F-box domain-containing protein n=1 Tax=Aegilops tauschii TaxID=37682 RepID=M8BMI3_AEGTA
MADWAALPSDLVRSVADRLLATAGDVDYYMDMRAVCHGWRLAMADPCRCITDIMLHDDEDDDEPVVLRLFLNVATGRFLRRRVLLLRDHVLVAASDGLLVLGDKKYPHRTSVLNPLTGSLVRFASAIPRVNRVRAAVTGSEDDPALSLVFSENGNAAWRYDLRDGSERRVSSFPGVRPFGLVQALLSYCVFLPDAKAQLHSVYRTIVTDKGLN